MENLKTIFMIAAAPLLLLSIVSLLCPARFDKKILSLLAAAYVFGKLISANYCELFDFGKEYSSIISEAEKVANDIRANIENDCDHGEQDNE